MKQLVCLILSVQTLIVAAKNSTISGYVTDSQTGERLIGATVHDLHSGAGTVTNVNGFYSLTLPSDTVLLQAGFVGYNAVRTEAFMLQGDTSLVIALNTSNILQEVVVERTHSISGVQSVQMSTMDVPMSQIKGIPMLGGEVDVLKALQLLPGVQSGAEGTAGLYVRGGGPDENLIMLDGVPLYSVNHALGFFSIFNADAVKSVTLYEGNFPARYGGRLSSIVDVRQKDGDAYGYHGSLNIGLIATKLSIEGPIFWTKEDWQKFRNKEEIKAQTTFNISARRTLYDLIIPPIMKHLSAKSGTGKETTGNYWFYDVNAKLTHTFSDNDKLSGSFYMGEDHVNMDVSGMQTVSTQMGDGSSHKESMSDENRLQYHWGNIFAALNYEHRFNGRLYGDFQFSYTRYKYALASTYNQEYEKVGVSMEWLNKFDSYIMDMTAQMNFEWRPNIRHEVHFGGSYAYHLFKPQIGHQEFSSIKGDTETYHVDTTFSLGGTNRMHVATLYIEDNYAPCSWLKMNIGLHAALYHTEDKTYPSVEPRIGVRFLPHRDVAIKMSYAYMSQYVHMLSNSSVSQPTDLWVPVTKDIPPMRSMQVATGVAYTICNQVELSVEGYYKKMINLLEYKDGASYMNGQNWQTQVCVGDGWCYGVQLLAQRKIGPVTGWIGYTWSRTMRQFDREGQVINFGKPFPAKYDREHDLSITMQYRIDRIWEVAATFVYGTGTRGTLGLQKYDDKLYTDRFDKNTGTTTVYYISERNNYKMPDYHRLDLGVTCHLPDKNHDNMEHMLNLSVYNAYCRFNPYLVYPKDGKLYQFSLFPIMPSLSYVFKF